LETYNQAKVNKIEDCLGKASIARIKRKTDKDTVIMFLRAIISKTSTYFNVSGNFNEDQIIDTANDILNLYYFLSIEDFKLCFKNGKRLRYNEKGIFRMDGSILLEWLDRYVEERSGIAENKSMTKHNEALSDNDTKELTDKKFYEKFNAKEVVTPKKEPTEKELKKIEQKKIAVEYHKDSKAYMEKLKPTKPK